MIDLRYVKKLIEMLDGSTVDSIEISSDKGMKLRISKSSQQRAAAVTMAPPVMAAPMMAAPAAPAVLPASTSARPAEEGVAPAPKAEAPKSTLLEIKSPMVGTFYRSASPGSEAFVQIGSVVKVGDPICIIEAMKIMNEIEADAAGTIREIYCENGQAVEFGQPLFVIE